MSPSSAKSELPSTDDLIRAQQLMQERSRQQSIPRQSVLARNDGQTSPGNVGAEQEKPSAPPKPGFDANDPRSLDPQSYQKWQALEQRVTIYNTRMYERLGNMHQVLYGNGIDNAISQGMGARGSRRSRSAQPSVDLPQLYQSIRNDDLFGRFYAIGKKIFPEGDFSPYVDLPIIERKFR